MTNETQLRASNTKISEALGLLNEAAREKNDELKGLMTSKYSHLREAMTIGIDQAPEVIIQGKQKVIEIASDVNKRVQKDPWVYIAGAAIASLLWGYWMGSKRK